MKHYTTTIILSLIALISSVVLFDVSGMLTVVYLTILGISLSFDNAVINASVLNNWNHQWRLLFLWVGLPIAVFGMRFFFPLAIASFGASISFSEALDMVLNNPNDFAKTLEASHVQVAGFGGAFLSMVFWTFFLDESKDNHWIPGIEKWLSSLAGDTSEKSVGVAYTFLIVLYASLMLADDSWKTLLVSGSLGIVAFLLTRLLAEQMGGDGKKVGQGVAGLLYLEVQDASFSFDDTIGSFAISNNIILIAIGLGIGALWVRSMTIHLVEEGTLAEYKYLENGAFWAIGVLSLCMLLGILIPIPEWFTGTAGAGIIFLSWFHSVKANKQALSAPR